jgi:cysteine-rich repeat protein
MKRLGLLTIVLLASCVRSQSIDCGDYTCPANTACAVELHQCLTTAQTTVCDALEEGRRCEADGNAGVCTQGYCIAGCGDGVEGADEECDDGNFASHDGCSSACLVESLAWHEVHDPWTPVSGLAVAHLARNGGTLVRFGGYDVASSTNLHWERNAETWRRITQGLPSPRQYMAYGYDTARDVLVIFGGAPSTSTALDETWEYDGTSWVQVPTNGKPTPRWGAAMAFDDARDVFVLFGGFAPATTSVMNDTWEYNPATKTWTKLTLTTAPSGRFWHAMTWDATAQRVVLFGGIGGDERAWRYDGTNRWVAITNTGPLRRPSPGLAFSPERQRVVLFGGRAGATIDVFSDTWELDTAAGTWTQVGASLSPPGRYEHAMVYDREHQAIALFGGFTGTAIYDDVWELAETNRWADVTPRYAPENPQMVQLAYDSGRARTVGLGYDRRTNETRLWEFDGAMWSVPANAERPHRSHYAIAYDAARSTTIVFGGYSQGNPLQQTTWAWDGITWTDHTATVAPPARYVGAMAQAGSSGGVVLVGGYLDIGASSIAHDSWVFDGSGWREIPLPDGIPAEGLPMLAYDASMERTILLTHESATWAFQNDTWTQLQLRESPPPRTEASLVFRRDRGKLLLYGGRGFTDAWELDGDTWRELELHGERPPQRVFAGAAYHERVRSIVLYGGGTLGGGTLEDTWLLQYESLTPDEICTNQIDDDGDQHTDADDPDCTY